MAVGVKRPSFGTSGKIMRAVVNMYRLEIPDGTIYHYDGEYFVSMHILSGANKYSSWYVGVIQAPRVGAYFL